MTEEFQVLDERERILKRPAMYIGSTSLEPISGIVEGRYTTINVVPGLLKIFNEILDNSIDEHIRTDGEWANKIDVVVSNTVHGTSIKISDNGRGIPVNPPKGQDVPTPVLAWTRGGAGSNFSDDDRTTLGMNGVGSFCTLVFSRSFEGKTNDGKESLVLKAHDNGEHIEFDTFASKSGERGTSVSFVPDLSRLGNGEITTLTEDHITAIRDRLKNLAVCFPGIRFRMNGETIKMKTVKGYAETFSSNPVTYHDDNNLIVVANSGEDEEFRILSYVNGLHIKNGGTHIDYIMEQIINDLRPMIKRKFKVDILPNQIKQHLLLVSIMRNMVAPNFDSQTKERLTNAKKDVESYFKGINFNRLAKKILETDEIIDPIVHAAVLKKEQAERAALRRKQKKLKRQNIPKHIEAQHKDPEQRSLFIAEGDSAMNPILNVRDPYTTGGYPLRGKPKNVWGITPSDIAKNKELSELTAILGLEYGKEPTDLNYGRIITLTDADTDGYSIACLLMCFFAHWPKLFEQGRVYRALTPLYVAEKGNEIKWFYNREELEKANLGKGWSVDYTKGLGGLPSAIYGEIINNPRLERVQYDSQDEQYLAMAFGDDSDKRKEWLLAS